MTIQHKQFSEFAPKWKKVRDVVEGEDRIKECGTAYLPMLNSQEEAGGEGYANYKRRAQFWGAAKRTMQGLVGAVLRKEPSFEGISDDRLRRAIQAMAGRNGEPLKSIAQQHLSDLVTVGRGALLVDKDPTPDPAAMPYIIHLRAEDVVFWVGGMSKGRTTPKMLVIRQDYEVPVPGDAIGTQSKTKTEWRVLRVGIPSQSTIEAAEGAFAGAAGEVYWQEIWRQQEDATGEKIGDGLVLHSVIVPTKNGGRFWSEIPCDVVNATGGITLECEQPQMLDLANVLLGHYLNSADLEWGRHLCAVPQPWVAGFQVAEGDRLVMGCGYAWATDVPGASANYLEFSGAGLGHIAEGMKAKEQQAAVLGARMLESQPAQAEAMGTVKLRQSGDRSVLATVAGNASTALSRAVARFAQWVSPAYDSDDAAAKISYQLSTDFDGGQMDPAELAGLVSALQAGTVSWETFAWNLRRGEMLPPGVSDDDERALIQKGAPGRSRKDEIAVLQADAMAGRIAAIDYFAQMQKLGFYEGQDPAALVAAKDDEATQKVERQMMALAQQTVANRPENQPPQDGEDDPPEDPPQGTPEDDAEDNAA